MDWINSIGIQNIASHKRVLTRRLIEGLEECGVELYVPLNTDMHTSVVSFNIPDYESTEVGMILDQDFGIAVRTGYHCAPLIHKLIGTEEKKGTGKDVSIEDIDEETLKALGILVPVDTAFAQEKHISSAEWKFERRIVDSQTIDSPYLTNAIRSLDMVNNGED